MIEYCTSLNVRPDGTENRCDGNDCTTLPDHAAETFQLFTEGDDLYASMLSAIGAYRCGGLVVLVFAQDAKSPALQRCEIALVSPLELAQALAL